MRTRVPILRTLPSTTYCTVSSRATRRTSTPFSRYWNEEFRAITDNDLDRDSSVIMSSVTPSEKYCCSGSPDILVKGRTAIDGLPDFSLGEVVETVGVPATRKTRTGSAMFF